MEKVTNDLLTISRRGFLKASAATCSLGLLGCAPKYAHAKKQLHICSWADYLHPDTIPEFQRRYNVEVIYDTVSSNEALLAKLQAGASDYDIIVPSHYILQQLKKLHKVAPIEKDRLTNFNDLLPRFRNPKFDPGCQFSIPYTWGTTGIAFNQKAFLGHVYPDDWDIFWDKNLSQRITLLDDCRETLGMALKHRGQSINTTDEAMLKRALQDLIQEKSLVMSYTVDQVILQLASEDALASMSFSGDAYQAKRTNPAIQYIIPRSGCALWVDNFCIPNSAPNPDNAYLWLNYMLEPQVAAANANFTRYSTPNGAALKMISSELVGDPSLYPSEAVLASCEELCDVGSAVFLYDKLWTELKCA